MKEQLGGSVELSPDKLGRDLVIDAITVGNLASLEIRSVAIEWLQRRVNDFVNVLRPRIRAAASDLSGVS
jgi:hypothetical protein